MVDSSEAAGDVAWETADGMVSISAQGRVLAWNGPAERLLGWTAAEVVGKLCCEVFGGSDPAGNLVCYPGCVVREMVRRREAPSHQEVLVRRADGRNMWVDMSTLVHRLEDGTVDRIVHVFRDVTSRRINEEHLRRTLEDAWGRSHQDPEIIASLTPREREVLELLATGLSTTGVSEKLRISIATVRNHSQNILNKLGVHSMRAAIAAAHPEWKPKATE